MIWSAVLFKHFPSFISFEPLHILLNPSIFCWTAPYSVEPLHILLNPSIFCWTPPYSVEPLHILLNPPIFCWTPPYSVEEPPHILLNCPIFLGLCAINFLKKWQNLELKCLKLRLHYTMWYFKFTIIFSINCTGLWLFCSVEVAGANVQTGALEPRPYTARDTRNPRSRNQIRSGSSLKAKKTLDFQPNFLGLQGRGYS